MRATQAAALLLLFDQEAHMGAHGLDKENHFDSKPNTRRVQQVEMTADLRRSLLADHGAVSYKAFAQLCGSRTSAVRAWVVRVSGRGYLFTVEDNGRILIPRVQLDTNGNLNEHVAALVQPLFHAGLDSWSLWAWLTSPTGRLNGEIPAEVAKEDPARARKAAALYAADIERSRGTAAPVLQP